MRGVYIESYDPTIEDSYTKEIEVDGRACNLEILDTAGVAQFTAMRELYIKSGQGFILVYSVTDKSSLEELMAIREQVMRIKESSNVPMVLVGNKCDLTNEREVTPEDGIEVSKKWNRTPFYEASAMYKMNVEDAFIDVVRQIIRKEVQVSSSGTQGSGSHQKEDVPAPASSRKPSESRKKPTPVAAKPTPAADAKKKKKKRRCVIL
ncbi:hypothetical protein KL918_000390 [Ogataea parapolymorpha]|nr:hypothetical protein KL918_000390 [Ogataea parapolymorpha]KAG7875135.1 hypothetical protein KL916_000747 [Ogataea parapolymorpha]